ncbi:hypothetical protein [Phenylobacterium sp.]|uniref:hypothetical protein n=1 Tax=Phenylobacterium sp. TaxID=1871053 RepID=UPI003BA9DE10
MGFEYIALPPIHHDPNMRGDGFERSNGIAAPFFFYISLVQRLAMLDVEAARREVAAWRAGDKVFSRLKIWAAGQPDLMSASQAARALLGLDPEHFWSSRHQRDLLLTLAARWAELPAGSRATLERRILRGPPRYEGEAPGEHRRSRGYAILDRVAWLEAQGCAFTVETQPALDRSRRDAPDWNAAGGVNAAASLEGRIGGVVRNTDAAALVDEAPATLLDAAETLTRREHGNLTEHRPLEGLALARPTKLLKALVMSDRKGGVSEWGWRTLLSADAEHQRPRLRRQIAERLARLSPQHLAALTYPATDWFKAVSPDLALAAPMTRDRLWSALIEMLRAHPEVGGSAIRSSRPDWRMSALNSPSGHLAQALMADPARLPVEGEGFPAAWLSKVTELLGLGGEAGRFAAVHLLYNIVWFFHFDPAWTEAHLLGRLQGDADDQDAFWSGFLTSAGAANLALYLRLKPGMLGLARQSRQDHDDTSALAGLLLSGWGSRDTADGERCISDMELRESLISGGDRFRGQVLWHLARWCEGPEGDWRDQALELFRSAWPRQRVVKTPKTSAELAEFAISFPGDFSALVEALVPHLTPVTADTWFLGALDNEESRRLDDQPTAMLTLIWAILADTASDWPYGSAALVEKLSEAPDLTADPRLAELRRRLAAR